MRVRPVLGQRCVKISDGQEGRARSHLARRPRLPLLETEPSEAGGWSLLLDASGHGLDGAALSERLLDQGVCATGMADWGERHGAQYIRFVYANEPVARLRGLGAKVRAALGA